MEKTTDKLILNVDQYGLKENKAEILKMAYLPMFDMLEKMEEDFNVIVAKDKEKAGPAARKLRLKIAKVRTSGDKTRKEAKAENIRENKAIQGLYNTLEYATKSKEKTLLDIEKYKELMEANRIAELQEKRSDEYAKYIDPGMSIPLNLGSMDEAVYNNFIFGAKANFEANAKAIKEAEKQTKAAAKKVVETVAKVEKVEAKNVELEEKIKKVTKASEGAQNIFAKKLAEQKQEREKAIESRDVKINKEVEKNADLQGKLDKVEKDKKVIADKKEKADAAPDKEKLLLLAKGFNNFDAVTRMETEKGKKLGKNIQILMGKIAKYITEQTDKF